jgi:phospho-N-acetylmuramoyl-pentapeptide-transferase
MNLQDSLAALLLMDSNTGIPFVSNPVDFWKRPLLAATIAVVCALASGPFIIRYLRQRFRERIASDSARLNELHAGKKDTPTMGGVLIMLAFLTGSAAAIGHISPSALLVFGSSLAFSCVGAFDDWIKLKTSKKGLTVRQKLLAQTIIAAVASTGLAFVRDPRLNWAATSLMHWLPPSMQWLFVIWSTFVIVASSNAVNLTDGLDGLAAGCTSICSVAMAALMISVDNTSNLNTLSDGAVFCSALAGASFGFLRFNRHPARVFMGDTGSLPLGGLLGLIAVSCQMELLLLFTGIVFVAEAGSVILQVFWYRRTGKRILLCSPLHNHFVFRQIKETRIVAAFWAVTAIVCVLTFFAAH